MKLIKLIKEMRLLMLILLVFTYIMVSCGGDDNSETNDFPSANDDSLVVNENSVPGKQNQVVVSANDNIGKDGGKGNDYSILEAPKNGNVTEVSDGVFEYLPNPNYFGEDSFMYTLTDADGDKDSAMVSVTVTEVNSEPIANDDTLTVDENSGAGEGNRINVSQNDVIGSDGGDGDDFSLLNNAGNGTVSEVSDGVFEYVPNADFHGADSFTYSLTDADGDSDTATVHITVNKSEPTSEDFANIDPNFPSFVSIDNTTPAGKKWVKLESMSDEFNFWDSSKWFKSTWNYGVPVYMSTSGENSGVSNGNLWIKATLNESNPEGRWFQTARIHSIDETKYPMYTEARIKAAHISAYNTYWLNNGDINNRDEIDIIENNSKPSCGCKPDYPTTMNSQYFHADSSLNPVTIRNDDNFNNINLSEANPARGVKWNEAYQTFGVWWKDSKNIQFYLNGEAVGSVTVGEDRSGSIYPNREFTRELEIIFDLWTFDADWIGGLALKNDLLDDTINTMKIDWVRTWKLEDE
ncbi:tandem-95 repeat protein [Tamlana fucoidanivorans]|uniref:Tandem-95 repeat protein n=1 Tax=Allotamlana fucoidanivorans TaxID=2583814 RepID=A0A5C4SRD7_9FLAO|nr:Ig-like domain-containing protein [Tamlana fucoidanivorans]TNJ46984.1 tandem-95 repeat protein [Tamlana fucoidanivorans]